MRVKLQLVMCHDDGHEETVTDVITLNKNNQRMVAYLLAADIVLGLPPSRLRRLTQPLKSPPNWLSTSRLLCLACL